MRKKAIGMLNGITASVSYGTNPLFALPLYSYMGVNSVLFYRYFFAVCIYFVWIKFIKKTCLKISFFEAVILFMLALVFSLSSLTLFGAFNYLASGIACTILFIYPIIVAVLSCIFFKEKITRNILIAILLTTVGIFLLYNGKADIRLNLKGVLLVLASALFYALYIVGVRNIKPIKHMKADKLSFYVMLFGLSVYVYNLKFCTMLQPINNWFSLLCLLGLAVFPTIISLETISVAIKLVGSTITAILGALEPLTAIFFGVLLFNEHLTVKIIVGIILIISGVLFIIFENNKKQKK